ICAEGGKGRHSAPQVGPSKGAGVFSSRSGASPQPWASKSAETARVGRERRAARAPVTGAEGDRGTRAMREARPKGPPSRAPRSGGGARRACEALRFVGRVACARLRLGSRERQL